jgi:hypothetical protein
VLFFFLEEKVKDQDTEREEKKFHLRQNDETVAVEVFKDRK